MVAIDVRNESQCGLMDKSTDYIRTDDKLFSEELKYINLSYSGFSYELFNKCYSKIR